MNRWLIAGIVTLIAGFAGFMIASRHQAPQDNEGAHQQPTAAAPLPPKPPEPVVLAQVVETADIDPLLDPQEKPITGVPFDEETISTPTPVLTRIVPDRIPPAAEEKTETMSLSLQLKGMFQRLFQ